MIIRVLYLTTIMQTLFSNAAYSEIIDKHNGKEKLKVYGQLMIDHTRYDSVFNKGTADANSYIRRARISFKYKASASFTAKLQIDYNEKKEELEEKEISLRYSGMDWADFKIGKFKQPFSLEYQTSSSNLLAMERSIATNAFSLGRSYGAALYSSTKQSMFTIGVFDATDEEDLFDAIALTARKTHAIRLDKDRLIHLGLAGSWRQGADERFQVNERIENYDAKSALESARFTADNIIQFGVEGAFQNGGFIFKGEYFTETINVKPNLAETDADLSGYYVQSSYTFEGKRRYKKGRFGALKSNTNAKNIELFIRLSQVDALTQNRGHHADTLALGINYYVHKHIRVMANLTHAKLEGINAFPEADGNAASVRLHIDY